MTNDNEQAVKQSRAFATLTGSLNRVFGLQGWRVDHILPDPDHNPEHFQIAVRFGDEDPAVYIGVGAGAGLVSIAVARTSGHIILPDQVRADLLANLYAAPGQFQKINREILISKQHQVVSQLRLLQRYLVENRLLESENPERPQRSEVVKRRILGISTLVSLVIGVASFISFLCLDEASVNIVRTSPNIPVSSIFLNINGASTLTPKTVYLTGGKTYLIAGSSYMTTASVAVDITGPDGRTVPIVKESSFFRKMSVIASFTPPVTGTYTAAAASTGLGVICYILPDTARTLAGWTDVSVVLTWVALITTVVLFIFWVRKRAATDQPIRPWWRTIAEDDEYANRRLAASVILPNRRPATQMRPAVRPSPAPPDPVPTTPIPPPPGLGTAPVGTPDFRAPSGY